MKVKVRTIAFPYRSVATASLRAILRNHGHGRLHVRICTRQLYDIMDELARRREISGSPFRSNEEALAEFQRHYMPLLTPRKPMSTPNSAARSQMPAAHKRRNAGSVRFTAKTYIEED